MTVATNNVLYAVRHERELQDEKWGQQNHDPTGWLAVLVEEVGEVAQTICRLGVEPIERVPENISNWRNSYREELVQVAAVAVAMIESLDRNGIREGT